MHERKIRVSSRAITPNASRRGAASAVVPTRRGAAVARVVANDVAVGPVAADRQPQMIEVQLRLLNPTTAAARIKDL